MQLFHGPGAPILRVLLACVLAFASVSARGGADHVDIVIVAGQSNARPQFAEGVEAAIEGSGRFAAPVVFHRFHSGNKIREWVAGSGNYVPGPNYIEDFWNPRGTGDLQEYAALLDARDLSWDIVGFVWFQGEADSARDYDRIAYPARFLYMLNALRFDFELDHPVHFVITQIDFNGDVEALADAFRTPEDIELTREMQAGIAADSFVGTCADSRLWPRHDLWHLGDHAHPSGLYGPSTEFGRFAGETLLTLPIPRSLADMNADDRHDLADILEFASRFRYRQPAADLVPPINRFDLADIEMFVREFTGSPFGSD